jgi:hypothetical protein
MKSTALTAPPASVHGMFDDSINMQGSADMSARQKSSPTVTVLVGQSESAFVVDQDLITKHSKFFSKALSRGWDEAKTLIVRLPKTCPEFFKLYALFLRKPVSNLEDLVDHALKQRKAADDRALLDTLRYSIELWLFGDYIQDYTFQNVAMEFLCHWDATILLENPDVVCWIAGQTHVESGLTKWLVDVLAPQLRDEEDSDPFLEAITGRLSAGFLMKLLRRRLKSGYWPFQQIATARPYYV